MGPIHSTPIDQTNSSTSVNSQTSSNEARLDTILQFLVRISNGTPRERTETEQTIQKITHKMFFQL